MKNIIARIEKKENGKYKPVNEYNEFTREYLTDKLMDELRNKYLLKCSWIKSIKRENHFNGTETVIVTYDNGYRTVYEIEI